MNKIDNIQIRLAGANGLETVTALFNAATNHMIQKMIFQWDEIYSSRNDIKYYVLHRLMCSSKISE